MAEKKDSPRKLRNREANEARHRANVATVAALGIEPGTTEQIVVRRDSKGNAYTVTVAKRVRESKAMRTAARERARRAASLVAEVRAVEEDAAIARELAGLH